MFVVVDNVSLPSRLRSVLLSIYFRWSGENICFFDMTDMVEDAETGGKGHETGGNLTEILTDGFMESFIPGLENLQGRLGELT